MTLYAARQQVGEEPTITFRSLVSAEECSVTRHGEDGAQIAGRAASEDPNVALGMAVERFQVAWSARTVASGWEAELAAANQLFFEATQCDDPQTANQLAALASATINRCSYHARQNSPHTPAEPEKIAP
jgi:hypothetical protein